MKIKEVEENLESDELDNLQWTDNAFEMSYNCSLTIGGPWGYSLCNVWPLDLDRYGNQRPRTTCSAHPRGQPLIIFTQILALQNLANVSRSNYIYLVLGHRISSPSLFPRSFTLTLLI